MEEKKAFRIGKLNIVDLVAIVLIVAVVAFGAYKLLRQDGAPPATIAATEDGSLPGVSMITRPCLASTCLA